MIRSFSLLLLSAAVVHAVLEDDFLETLSAVGSNSSIEPREMVAPVTARQETSYPCTTRKHAQCNGIPVSECPKLYTLYSKVTKGTATVAEKDVLRDAYCNVMESNELIMCCESNPRPNPEPLQCGKNHLNKNTPRVVGPATLLGVWPWMTALYVLDIYTQNTTYVCGGSLIGSEWVLTAAHCIPTKPNEILVKVRLGDLDLNSTVQDGANPIERGVSLAIIHPKYSREKILNDIALVRLREPVKYTDYIRPICLRTSIFANESTYLKMKPTVIGWGGTYYYGGPKPPTHLQEVGVNVVSQKDCRMKYANSTWRTEINEWETKLCARALGKDACRGDSGGPLMFLDSDLSWALGGIVSFGKGCAARDFPGVYTKVSSYIPWIEQKTNLKF